MSLLLASSRRCDSGDMTASDFPPGSADGQVWLWDASAGEWTLRVLTAADVGAMPDTYAPAWGDVTGKPSSYPPESHSHGYNSLDSKPFMYSWDWNWTSGSTQLIYSFANEPRSTTLFIGLIKIDATLEHYGFTVYATWDGSSKVTINTAAITSGYSIYIDSVNTRRIMLQKPSPMATTLSVSRLQFAHH